MGRLWLRLPQRLPEVVAQERRLACPRRCRFIGRSCGDTLKGPASGTHGLLKGRARERFSLEASVVNMNSSMVRYWQDEIVVWLVCSVCLVHLVYLVDETDQRDQIDQIDQIDQLNKSVKLSGRVISAIVLPY